MDGTASKELRRDHSLRRFEARRKTKAQTAKAAYLPSRCLGNMVSASYEHDCLRLVVEYAVVGNRGNRGNERLGS